LVVDDDPVVRRLGRRVMETVGGLPVEARSADEAADLLGPTTAASTS
jgi:CheY-like chemotaxis protein